MRRWVGIDEAGYGPNLGPLVMTSVTAEDLSGHPSCQPRPDLWKDLELQVARAGGDQQLLWIDDSKKVYRGGQGRERLDSVCALLIEETGIRAPGSVSALLQGLQAGGLEDCELAVWQNPNVGDCDWPRPDAAAAIERLRALRPLSPVHGRWRIAEVRTVVVGPARFNASLHRFGSKAAVHFEAFSQLLRPLWDQTADGDHTSVSCDKHGGRHFYLEPLRGVFADEWIERGPEGPALSRYLVRREDRSLELSFAPRADADNGLVALASIVSKAIREVWMEGFNAFWQARIPDLRATAGYPVDASRFRRQIEGLANELGLEPRIWWRDK